MPRQFFLLILFAVVPLASAQQYIEFRQKDMGAVGDVTVKIFAAENSHVDKVDVIPLPRLGPVWEGKTNPIGVVNIPDEYLDGRRALIWARKGKFHAFFALGKEGAKIKQNMTLAMRRYRPVEIKTKTADGKPAEHIPVFLVDAISLGVHHLS